DDVAHVRSTRVRQHGSVPQRARAEFHPALKPANDFAVAERVNDAVEQRVVVQFLQAHGEFRGCGAASGILERRSPEGVVEHKPRSWEMGDGSWELGDGNWELGARRYWPNFYLQSSSFHRGESSSFHQGDGRTPIFKLPTSTRL